MPYLLKNKNFEIYIDQPEEHYNSSRFDWTGKITNVKYKGISLGSREHNHHFLNECHGQGLYNEFGIDMPIGFEKTKIGDWFHKIGIGLLKKEQNYYHFNHKYLIKPATFYSQVKENTVLLHCISDDVNGYAYELRKHIVLHDTSFCIYYDLQNTGSKPIITQEYVHNFLAVNHQSIDDNYRVKFPFNLRKEVLSDDLNPEEKLIFHNNEICFNSRPENDFFMRNLALNEPSKSYWELRHLKEKISISEHVSKPTCSINIWGRQHVISPEMYIELNVKPGQSNTWSRTYQVRLI